MKNRRSAQIAIVMLALSMLTTYVVYSQRLDGDPVGSIKSGEIDRMLAVGLLGEWKRHLGV